MVTSSLVVFGAGSGIDRVFNICEFVVKLLAIVVGCPHHREVLSSVIFPIFATLLGLDLELIVKLPFPLKLLSFNFLFLNPLPFLHLLHLSL